MLTGCRRDEIGGLQWSELDLERGLLSIPGARTKNHHALNLTLPAAAVSILRSIGRREGRDYVFGERGGTYSAWSYSTLNFNARIAARRSPPAWPKLELLLTSSKPFLTIAVVIKPEWQAFTTKPNTRLKLSVRLRCGRTI